MSTLINSSSLASELYCTTTISGDVIDTIDDDTISTMLVTGISTAVNNSMAPTRVVVYHDSLAYVESLTDEELATLDKLLSDKELSFANIEDKALPIEAPKVYQKK